MAVDVLFSLKGLKKIIKKGEETPPPLKYF